MKSKHFPFIIGAVAISLLAVIGVFVYFRFFSEGVSSDVAYQIGHKVYLSENEDSFFSAIDSKITDSFTDAEGNVHTSENTGRYLIVKLEYDFANTDYSSLDIVSVSECFKDTELHSCYEKLTDALNGFSVKTDSEKKGILFAVDIVDPDFSSEYMEIGITNLRGISEQEKFIIQ